MAFWEVTRMKIYKSFLYLCEFIATIYVLAFYTFIFILFIERGDVSLSLKIMFPFSLIGLVSFYIKFRVNERRNLKRSQE